MNLTNAAFPQVDLPPLPDFDSLDDSASPVSGPPKKPRSEISLQHYSTIGHCLSICEASSMRVGVPWVFPSRQVQALVREYTPPLDEFVQYSLSNVNTATIEAYREEMLSSSVSAEEDSVLGLAPLSFLERYACCVLAPAIVSGLTAAASAWLEFNFHSNTAMFSGCALFAVLAMLYFCDNRQRLKSFAIVLEREINRRKGLDVPFAQRVPLVSLFADWSPRE